MVSFQLYEMSSQTPTNEHAIHHLRHLINRQTLNLLDPNRCVLNTTIGSVTVGRESKHFFCHGIGECILTISILIYCSRLSS